MSLESRGHLDGVGRVRRGRMCDRNHRHDLAPLHYPTRGDNGARPVLATFFDTVLVLARPEVGIGNYQAGNRLGQAHGVQSLSI